MVILPQKMSTQGYLGSGKSSKASTTLTLWMNGYDYPLYVYELVGLLYHEGKRRTHRQFG